MDLMQSFDAILFPADGRPPHVVSLMTSPASFSNPHAPAQTSAARVPHPEVHMEYIAEDPNLRAWHFQFVEALDMMNKKFANPYIIYYPVVSRDGMPFPVNRTVRDIQEEVNKGRRLPEEQLWRGNLVAAKFTDDHFTQMIDASMADFPILKNFLGTHASPCSNGGSNTNGGGGSSSSAVQTPHPAHPSPPSLHATATAAVSAPLPPHYPAARQMYFTEQQQPQPIGPIPQATAYEREPSTHVHVHPHVQTHSHAHGIPMTMPAPRRSPKNGAEHQHQQHQHQHQHQQHQHQHQHQYPHQHQPPMEM